MSADNPPCDMQDEFLYDSKWKKPIDDLFIDIICVQQTIGHFNVGKKNLASIGVAIDSISRQLGVDFTYAECQRRISTLFRRYSTFVWMLSHADFMYDPVSKYVHAPARRWQFFMETNHFTMAYRFKGDPKWDDLLSIYGPREPAARAIVLLSDDSDDNSPARPAEVRARPTPLAVDTERAPSMLSRNMQRSMWEYIGYASNSDEASIDANGSTANSTKEMRKVRHAQKNTEPTTSSFRNPTIGSSSGSSFNNSSCASNDPFGKRNV